MKYLLLVASAMNLYLLGVGMVFLAEGSFGISSITITGVPAGFLIAGLLGKTGLFLFSMWLVDLHSSVSSEISALLSGIAVKTGLYALLRLRPALGNHFEVVPFFAVISAILGVIFAFHEKHYKRILAYSTLSQIGYILIAPETGIFYVFAHGIFKSWLFLGADLLPNYDTGVPSRYRLPIFTWSLVALPALSIAGFPWTVGGSSKRNAHYGNHVVATTHSLRGECWNSGSFRSVFLFPPQAGMGRNTQKLSWSRFAGFLRVFSPLWLGEEGLRIDRNTLLRGFCSPLCRTISQTSSPNPGTARECHPSLPYSFCTVRGDEHLWVNGFSSF